MSRPMSMTWYGEVADRPVEVALELLVLVVVVAMLGLSLRALTRRSRSLRHQVLAVALSSLVIGAAASVALARLMILDSSGVRRTLIVLAVTAGFSTMLVFVSTSTLGRDVRRLEESVRRIESGAAHVPTGLRRADEIGHVARALDELIVRLDTAERERVAYESDRRVMLSSISHDLRTPLSALRAATEALVDGVAPDPERYLRSMQHDIVAVTALVDDLFLLARLESGRFDVHREAIDLAEIADEAIECLRPMAAAKDVGIELQMDSGVRVQANATALGRVIRNLLDNAIRHAPDGSTVRVVVSQDGLTPSVIVIDEGDGFSVDFAARAFDSFARADPSRTRATGGAGLGLAIARGLVEAQGGRIWIAAPPGGRVAFVLPAA